jgi:hypothetical protein
MQRQGGAACITRTSEIRKHTGQRLVSTFGGHRLRACATLSLRSGVAFPDHGFGSPASKYLRRRFRLPIKPHARVARSKGTGGPDKPQKFKIRCEHHHTTTRPHAHMPLNLVSTAPRASRPLTDHYDAVIIQDAYPDRISHVAFSGHYVICLLWAPTGRTQPLSAFWFIVLSAFQRAKSIHCLILLPVTLPIPRSSIFGYCCIIGCMLCRLVTCIMDGGVRS